MLALVHILAAVTSLIFSGYLLFNPSKLGLRVTYWLVCATFLSGTLLIATRPSHILSTCISGLAYLFLISIGIALANRKLIDRQ